MNIAITLLIVLCICSICIIAISGFGLFKAKKSGVIEGTEEYYVKKYELDELKKILIDAVADDTKIVPRDKTLADFSMDVDMFVEYQMQQSMGKKTRDLIIERSKPHIENIKRWCAKHKDGLDAFRKSTALKITYLDGTQKSPEGFYRLYMDDVSVAGKTLLSDVCKTI